MKPYKFSQKIILSFIGISTAITLGFFSSKTVKAQRKLQSVPEISWSIRLSSFELDRQNVGQIFTFRCPKAPRTEVYAPVWGTDIYTLNSGLCKSAVHAGMISIDGGLINVELTAEASTFQGSNRFGVSSKDYERAVPSFRFIGNPIVFESDDQINDDSASRRSPSPVERAISNGALRGIERTVSDAIRDIFR